MRNRMKKILACGMAVAIVAGNAVTAFAADSDWGAFPDEWFANDPKPSSSAPSISGGNDSAASNATPETEKPLHSAVPIAEVDLAAYADEIFRLANLEREKAGLAPAKRCTEMDKVAAIRAKELFESFSHTRPNGEWYTSLADEAGITYKYVGENAAKVPITSDAAKMMRGWMNSEGHRNNLLYTSHAKVGIAVYQEGQMLYCSLMLYY